MNEATVKKLAQVYGLGAQVEAIRADIAAMRIDNAQRLDANQAPAYGAESFFKAQEELEELAKQLKALAADDPQ